jgi:hypothetical protein
MALLEQSKLYTAFRVFGFITCLIAKRRDSRRPVDHKKGTEKMRIEKPRTEELATEELTAEELIIENLKLTTETGCGGADYYREIDHRETDYRRSPESRGGSKGRRDLGRKMA